MIRLDDFGIINRSTPVSFEFDGQKFHGFEGDSLASALLANQVRIVGRSFKYHRARGIYADGVEEPNALVSVGEGSNRQPNLQATTVELSEGLVVTSQNRWPSLKYDLLSINQLFAPFMRAGFYYKTFMGPFAGAWMFYERWIRRAAGLGLPPVGKSEQLATRMHQHCDVLVIGGGLAGIEAACAAAEQGALVMLVEQDFCLGGRALAAARGSKDAERLSGALERLGRNQGIQVLTRATAFGAYDGKLFGVVETGRMAKIRHLRAARVVLASGAHERGFIFPGNDLPGVMLAGAARMYLNRYGVLCGNRVVVAANNNSAFEVAIDMAIAGAEVLLIDQRAKIEASMSSRLQSAGVVVRNNAQLVAAHGRGAVSAVTFGVGKAVEKIDCDLVCVSSGWSPAIHLATHNRCKPKWDFRIQAFIPAAHEDHLEVVGAAAGDGLATVLPIEKGYRDADDSGSKLDSVDPSRAGFVDFQNDVTAADIAQAVEEGFESIEHIKRYTTLGMGTDQGKTGNVTAQGLVAAHLKRPIEEIGTTVYRPPFTPVPLGALAGQATGVHYQLRRRTGLHDVHLQEAAVMIDSGLWERAWFYRENGKDVDAAYRREMGIVRESAAICDMSTLGKILIQGPDAAELLNRVYVNNWESLAIGKSRWGVMLRDDGYVFDDGTTTRLEENSYFMTTTTAKAVQVLARLEFMLQTCWIGLRVKLTSVSDQLAVIALTGPESRAVLSRLLPAEKVSNENLPFMARRELQIAGFPVGIARLSFTGELGYEIYARSHQAVAVWKALRQVGAGVFGLEALGALRIEKGHIAGNEIDGHTTLDDLGLARMARKDERFIGASMMQREGLTAAGRCQLVGLQATSSMALATGSVLSYKRFAGIGDGRITSATWSPAMHCHIALGLLKDGRERIDEIVTVHNPAQQQTLTARVREPCFLDPEGLRMRA